MARTIFFASGKGGTGKSTVAAALACAIACTGRRVAAIDLDAGMGNLDLYLGMHESAIFSCADLISAGRPADDCFVSVPGFGKLRLLAAPVKGALFEIQPEQMAAMSSNLNRKGEWCILDCAAGFHESLSLAAAASSLGLIVCNADWASLRDAAAVVSYLHSVSRCPLRIVCNRMPKSRKGPGGVPLLDVDTCMDFTGLPLAAVIHEDRAVSRAVACCRPLLEQKKSIAVDDITQLAWRLIKEKF